MLEHHSMNPNVIMIAPAKVIKHEQIPKNTSTNNPKNELSSSLITSIDKLDMKISSIIYESWQNK